MAKFSTFFVVIFFIFCQNLFGQRQDSSEIKIQIELSKKYSIERPDSTISIALKVYEASKKINWVRGLIESSDLLGRSYYVQGNYFVSLENYLNLLKLLDSSPKDYRRRSLCLIDIGTIYRREGFYEQALDYYNKAQSIAQETKDEQLKAVVLNQIGLTYYNQKNYEKALEYGNQSIDIGKKIKDQKNLVVYLNAVGLYNSRLGRYSIALEYFFESLLLNELHPNFDIKSATNDNIGDVYLLQGDLEKCVIHFKRGLEIAQSIHARHRRAESYESFYKLYEKKGQYKEALDFHLKATSLLDSINNERNNISFSTLLNSYELTKKQREINELELNRKNQDQENLIQRYFLLFFVIIIITGIIFIFFILRINNQRLYAFRLLNDQQIAIKKQNSDLNKKNNNIERKNLELYQVNSELKSILEVVDNQRKEMEKTSDELRSSISYAKRIQRAILPSKVKIEDVLGKNNFFIIYKPKDIVSGDFYWFAQKSNITFFAVADCTGNGVSGAFMSMMANELLRNMVLDQEIITPNYILSEFDKRLALALNKNKKGALDDGIDISIVTINRERKVLHFASANSPVIVIQNHELIFIKGDKKFIGSYDFVNKNEFTLNEISLTDSNGRDIPTIVYLFSDGFQDQFGGRNNKKFMITQLRELILSVHTLEMDEQKEILTKTLDIWMADSNTLNIQTKQTDDITLVGFKI